MARCFLTVGADGDGILSASRPTSAAAQTATTTAAATTTQTWTNDSDNDNSDKDGRKERRRTMGRRRTATTTALAQCATTSSTSASLTSEQQFRPPAAQCRHAIGGAPLCHCPYPRRLCLLAFPRGVRCLTLPLVLFLTVLSSFFSCTTNARKSNEIEADWSLQHQRQQPLGTVPSSPLAQSEQLLRQFVPTKYLRLKDVLRFHCPPPNVPLSIHLVPAESALLCQLPAEQRERERALIGYCGPNTSDPRLTIRQYSPLPGKPTFRPGLSYFFISTSDGTAAGVQAISGGLCRSNALRLRVVVLPTSANDALSSSRPADEITDLAELLFPHSPSSSVAPPAPSASPPYAVAAASFGVFPAVLTLEDRGGQRRQVLVHSPDELAAQIDSASQRSGGAGLELSVQQQQQRRRGGGIDGRVGDGQMPRYELSSSNGERGDTGSRHPMKSVRSPDPLAESQKLVYIIGYGDSGAGGHGATSDCGTRAPLTTLALCIFALITSFVLVP